MATFLLLRHGNNDWVGRKLAGRLPGVHLNDEGRAQSKRAAAGLSRRTIHRIVSSPLERALETAEPLAAALALPVEQEEAFLEVLFGEWEGQSIPGLDDDPRWRLFNTFRSGTPAPGGELASEMQARFVAGLGRLHAVHPEETIVVVSHADPIRAALASVLGMPLDFMTRIEIRPASVSEVEWRDWGPRVIAVNRTFEDCGC